ncbi:hypothetical protein CEQ90_15680 [Lewinellaceae bacterium SD302]|nr:hypothetical protein CEQ90_15680 [Lewinellaceae bacterium SD302]
MKMKPSIYKLSLFLSLFISFQLSAANASDPGCGSKREFVKNINKTFDLDADGRLELSNRHGYIDVQSWNQEKTTIDIKIIVNAGDQEDANKVFERVRIDFSHTSNLVSVKTQIGSETKGWWDRIFGGFNSDDFKIVYQVKMPNEAFLRAEGQYCNISVGDHAGEVDVYTRYGNIDLEDIGDQAEVQCQYGNINIETLAADSRVEVGYGNLDIDKASGTLDVQTRYGELRIDEAPKLDLDCRYTELRLGKIGTLRLNGSYGDLRIEEVNIIRASTTYSEYEIEKAYQEVDISTGYGDVEIDWLQAGFTEVRIKGSYSDIEVRMDPTAGYELNARTSYASIDYPSGLDVSRKENKSNSESIVGKHKGQGSGKLELASSYGDISVRD